MKLVTPTEAGFSAIRLNRIKTVMQSYVDQNILKGLITLLARRGQVFHLECLGLMDAEAHKVMQPDVIFRIYSMSKPITSVAMMMLYEEGRFQLNEPVSKYIPEFKNLKVLHNATETGLDLADAEREITIRDLLTHTSGLSYGLFDESLLEKMYQEANMFGRVSTLKVSLQEVIYRLAKLPLAHQPGRHWRYSMATDVIGYLVGLLADMPFDTFLAEKIFNPLGMADTAFYVPGEKIDRFAAMYGPTAEKSLDLVDAPATSPFTNPNYNPAGGGGLVSTVTDYLRFAQMLLNDGELDGTRLLGRKTIELMTTNHLPPELIPIQIGPFALPGYGFGLGFRVMVNVPQSGVLGSTGEFGWSGMAGTYFWIDPKEELIGLFMPQFYPSSLVPLPIRDIIRILTYQALVN
jgi:CubicO group peptidase (beta-lactamase class C family)